MLIRLIFLINKRTQLGLSLFTIANQEPPVAESIHVNDRLARSLRHVISRAAAHGLCDDFCFGLSGDFELDMVFIFITFACSNGSV